jgi:hypothetical protein
MHLICTDIVEIAQRVVSIFCDLYKVRAQDLYNVEHYSRTLTGQALRDYSQALDIGAAGWIAGQAKTFVFDSEQILAFLAAIDRQLPPGDYPAPFPFLCIQFSRGIDETLFTSGR